MLKDEKLKDIEKNQTAYKPKNTMLRQAYENYKFQAQNCYNIMTLKTNTALSCRLVDTTNIEKLGFVDNLPSLVSFRPPRILHQKHIHDIEMLMHYSFRLRGLAAKIAQRIQSKLFIT